MSTKLVRLARLMVRLQTNISHLNVIGIWGYLAEELVNKSVREKQSQIEERWKLLVKWMNDRDPDAFSLRRFESINQMEISKIRESQRNLREMGRFDFGSMNEGIQRCYNDGLVAVVGSLWSLEPSHHGPKHQIQQA